MAKKPLNHLRRRTSLYGHQCCVCLNLIEPGEDYYDGGYYRRAHVLCGDKSELDPSMEKTRAEQDTAAEKRFASVARRETGVDGG